MTNDNLPIRRVGQRQATPCSLCQIDAERTLRLLIDLMRRYLTDAQFASLVEQFEAETAAQQKGLR